MTKALRVLSIWLLLGLVLSTTARAQVLTQGTIAADAATIRAPLSGAGSVTITITGTWTGTLEFETMSDGSNFNSREALDKSDDSKDTSTTGNGVWALQNEGYTQVQVRASAWSSGTATITITRGSGLASSSSATISGDVTVSDVGITSIAAGDNNIGNVDVVTLPALPTGANVIGAVTQSGTWSTRTLDGSGNTIGSTSNALDVNIKSGGSTGVAQGSTTSGQLGTLTMGAVTTAAPSYTNAQTSPLSITTGGLLRTSIDNTPTFAIGQTTTQNDVDATITNATLAVTQSGNWTARLADGAGNALTSITAGAQQAITVSVVDSSGNHVSSFGGSGGTSSAFGAAFPSGASSGTAIGGYDGTNMQGLRVVDTDTSGGSFWTVATNAVFRTSGTPVEAGTSSNPWNVVFPSAQTVTANAGTNLNTSALALESGGNLATIAGMFGTAGTADTQVVTVQGIASMTPILATLSGTNNIATVTAVTSITNALPAGTNNIGDVDIVSFPDNEPINVAQMNGVAVTMGNGASGTGVQRVTIADNSTGVLASIGSITTAIVPGTGATNLGKAEDAAHTSADVGVMALTKRTNTAASSTSTDGDYATLNSDSVGALWVNPFSQTQAAGTYLTTRLSDGTNFLTPGTDYTHDAALTASSTAGPMLMGRASSAAPTNVSANDDAVLAWFLQNGAQVVNLSASGTLITATGTSVNMNCTGGCSGGTQYAEDIAHTSGDSMTMAGVVRRNTASSGTSADGDIATLNVDTNGKLWTNAEVTAALPAGSNVIGGVTQSGTWNVGTVTTVSAVTAISNALPAGTNNIGDVDVIGGGVAHDAAAAAVNPLLIGAYASQAAPSDVSADNDSVRLWALRNGSQVVNLAAGGTLITATSSSLNTNVTNSTLTVVGGAAHDAAVSGAPVLLGAYASATAPSAVSANGDAVRLWAGTNGQLATMLVDSSGSAVSFGSGGTSSADDAAFTVGTTNITPAGGIYRSSRDSVDDNDTGALAMTQTRALYTTLENASGTAAFGTAGSAASPVLTVQGITSMTPFLVNPGTAANFGIYVEDAGETAGGNLAMAGTVRRDTLASSAGSTGDNATLNTAADGALYVANVGATNGGGSLASVASAASTNATSVKASAGQVYGIYLVNTTATLYYLRLYNLATSPTCSSATGYVTTLPIPASTTGAGFSIPVPIGAAFSTGIAYCITGGASSTDNTNAATGIYGTLIYK